MIVIMLYILLSGSIGLFIYRRQNVKENGKVKLGGEISPSKALWLYWTISVWFMLLPYALLTHRWQDAFHYGWYVLTISMWVRGIAEIYMLFVSKNWTPYIGISHDVITLVAVAIAYLLNGNSFLYGAWWVQMFSIALLVSLTVEIYYAKAFLKIVGAKTKGDDGIWYAHKNDPAFIRLLQVTTTFNILLYAATFIFLYYFIQIKRTILF